MEDKKKIIATNITEQQKKDTGLALTLVFLIIGFVTKDVLFFKLTIPIILITMLIPALLHPAAILWFDPLKLSRIFCLKDCLNDYIYNINCTIWIISKIAWKR